MFYRKKTKEERNEEKFYSMTDEEIIEAKERLEKEPLFEPISTFSRTENGKSDYNSVFFDLSDYFAKYGNMFTKEMDDDSVRDKIRDFQRKGRTERKEKVNPLIIIVDKPPYKSIYDSMETETIQFEMI